MRVWLWWSSEERDGLFSLGGDIGDVEVWIDERLAFRAPAETPDAQNFPFSLVEEFFRALASNLRANVHVEIFYGRDGHHIAESAFKALARALRVAVSRDDRVKGVPSTKEML